MRKPSMAVLIAAVSISLAAGPAVAQAKSSFATKKSVKSLSRQLRGTNNTIRRSNAQLDRALKTAIGALNGNINDVASLKGAFAAFVQAAAPIPGVLTQLANGLKAIQTALLDPTTGLVGLNNARPQFGAFTNAGVFIDGTGAHPPAKGPSGNANEGAGALANFYVVHFNNDVSARFLTVTQFPTGGASSNRAAMAVDCAASAAASALCSAIQGSTDNSPFDVAVQFGSTGSGAADTSWEVMATSG